MKDKENHCVANFATFVPNWINKILVLTKILYFSDEIIVCFLNGCNKVVIELRVVQFWSEIILVISNRTRVRGYANCPISRIPGSS